MTVICLSAYGTHTDLAWYFVNILLKKANAITQLTSSNKAINSIILSGWWFLIILKRLSAAKHLFYEYDSIIILWTTCLGLSLQHTRNQFQLFPPRASVNQPSLLSFTKYAGKKSTRHWRDKNVKALTNKEIFLMSSVMGFPISLE